MLQLKDIKKDYETAGNVVHALKGVTLRFRKNEFVSVLGASGCGKTTLLNIIGGLDHYTSGDLVICGRSTKDYNDRDWDVYRNHRIGFVFQSYNLIPHQTVLGNVELALTIAGVSKTERRRRAEEALIKVGLKDELYKRPNQLSGGQMQRVAIARALVNNPEILLADEPTGALDTQTSIQIMELIREIAGERLVIMVTHNPEIAEQYSTRIVRLQDGLVVSDSDPYEPVEEETEQTEEIQEDKKAQRLRVKEEKKARERSSMSFRTALGLSARNLLTKKGRTALTSVAGSIGIISVCLVLALSNGFNNYILQTEEQMLSSNPVQITRSSMDITSIMENMNSVDEMPDLDRLGDEVYVNSLLTNMANDMTVTNDLSRGEGGYIEYLEKLDKTQYAAIQYNYGMSVTDLLYTDVITGEGAEKTTQYMSLAELKAFYKAEIETLDPQYASISYLVDYMKAIVNKIPNTADMTDATNLDYVKDQYEKVAGEWPTNPNEAIFVVGSHNDVFDLSLAQLGYIAEEDFVDLFEQTGEVDTQGYMSIPYADILAKEYLLMDNDAIYTPTTDPAAKYEFDSRKRLSKSEYESYQSGATAGATKIEVTAVVRLKADKTYGCLKNGLNVTEQVIEEYIARNKTSAIAKAVTEKAVPPPNLPGMEALQGMKLFTRPLAESMETYFRDLKTLTESTALPTTGYVLINETAALQLIGASEEISAISIYAYNFENKENILSYLDGWNEMHEDNRAKQVQYTDSIGLMMTMVGTILDAVTYVLVAFTAISLVVSSVMIGIITYVSVVERTKEIGVLRSLGARKKDIKNLFNAETFIIGLTSGLFGVAVTYLLALGVNSILGIFTGIPNLASLPILSAAIMVCVSVALTLISGLIPARAAAKKDPVVALRTE
ncbi:MAG: ATP-binding cassette domain-containing protein [Clostridia bacterium]|nr:ATP-binding cassette domain-containing protein [Clostridia bacterium]